MERKVVRTELDSQEYENLLATAQKMGLSIKEALRRAALRWAAEESGIDSKDPIFDIALGRRKAVRVKLKGSALEKARKSSEYVDRAVYDESPKHAKNLRGRARNLF